MKNRRIGGIILTALLFAVALITIVPFIWMFISSFAPNSEIVKVTGGLFPKPSALANYVSIQEKFNFLRLFINSLVVAGLKTGIAVYTSAVLGYVFSKMRFRGRNLLFGVVMSTMMIPWAVTIIPQYEMFTNWGLQDTYTSLVLPGMISAFGIFLFRQTRRCFRNQNLPQHHPADEPQYHRSIGDITFLWNWEDYLWPFLMITDEKKQLLAVGLKAFNGQYGTDYGGLFAATSLAIVPVIIVYMIFQKQFIAGIATGSGK